MSPECRPEHEGWLELRMTGGADFLSAAQRDELERCPRCAAELAELMELQGILESTAEDERETLALVEREAGPAEERWTAEVYARRIAPRAGRGRRRIVFAGVLLAAAAVVIFLALRAPRTSGERAPEVLLGPEEITILAPKDQVEADGFETYRWEPLPGARDYRVTVLGLAEDGSLPELLDRIVEGTTLTLDPATTADWPATIAWSVEARDASGRAIPGSLASREAERPAR